MKKQLNRILFLLPLCVLIVCSLSGCFMSIFMDVHEITGRTYIGISEDENVEIVYRNNENHEMLYDGETVFYSLYPDSVYVPKAFLRSFLRYESRATGKMSIRSAEYNICVERFYQEGRFLYSFMDTDAMKNAEREGIIYLFSDYSSEIPDEDYRAKDVFCGQDFLDEFTLMTLDMQYHSAEHISGTVISGTLLEPGTRIDFYYQK